MQQENILDSEYAKNEKTKLQISIIWWEEKRILFNLILIGVEILMITIFWKGAVHFGMGLTIFWSFLYTMAANIFFSIGWGIRVIIDYYDLKFLDRIDNFRMLLFIIGVIFTVFLTFFLFRDTLYYFQVKYFFNQ